VKIRIHSARVNLGGVRFLGATLWTDFALSGSAPSEVALGIAEARLWMNDFRLIRYSERGAAVSRAGPRDSSRAGQMA
jgi:hypothetical protein